MPAAELALLVEAAEEAGRIAMRYFRLPSQHREKSGGQGPVTEADLEIDRVLRRRLLAARPGYGWLSEETEDDPRRLERRRVFIVDPIDGTRAFIARRPDFAHSLALAEEGEVIAAVVWMPRRGLMWTAARGAGTRANGRPVRVSARRDLAGAEVLATRANLAPEHWRGGPPPVRRRFRSSLAYRLATVAEGRFDAMLTLRPVWEWDVAAGALLVAEAGGLVRDALGRPPRFNTPRARLPGLLAGAPAVVEGLLERIAPETQRAAAEGAQGRAGAARTDGSR
ncbi:MAG: 3'(2'),5'-bisphosphate nucleotidase CysQ [Alphaproteobacteria bacterium]|nr:MAG: 3'(2'),5'-bisphosphate nucleotidase CysQ [Alphaproteobacteria bacterium]